MIVPIGLGTWGPGGLDRTPAAVAAALAEAGWQVDVAVVRKLDRNILSRDFGLVLDQVSDRMISEHSAWTRPLRASRLIRQQLHQLRFYRLTRSYDLAWVQSSNLPLLSGARHSVLFTDFPRDTAPSAFAWRRRLASYDRVTANSKFTARWVERYWKSTAEVFSPSVMFCDPAEKKQAILTVGRFVEGERDKRQLQMVQAFARLVTGGLEGWELWLAGFKQSADYLEAVRRAAADLPIRFFVNATAAEIHKLYSQASLFWHAAGSGIDPEVQPHLAEHFGIVVAEAMTAECLPLVFDAGGPPEIVGNPELCWRTEEELVVKTRKWADNPRQRELLARDLSHSARQRFSASVFRQRLAELCTRPQ